MKVFYLILTFIIAQFCFAQNDSTNTRKNEKWKSIALEASYENGQIFATNEFVKGINSQGHGIISFQALSLKCSKNTNGKYLWEQLYNYPNYGIGLHAFDFGNPEEIGYPFAFYGFFNAPFKRWEKFTFNYEMDLGVAFNFHSFDPYSNPYNISTGSSQTAFFGLGLDFKYALTNKFEAGVGFFFRHFSNGKTKEPNAGFNMCTPVFNIKYHFNERPELLVQPIPKYTKENEWLISFFGGVKNVVHDSVNVNVVEKWDGAYFPIFGVNTTFNRQIGYKSKVGIGLSFTYADIGKVGIENGELVSVWGVSDDGLRVSIYPSYELVVQKISLILQPGFYLYCKDANGYSTNFYQRVGLKYNFSEHLFFGFYLRASQFSIADFLEWNIGYRIKWK